MLTRSDLIAALAERGYRVTAFDLQNWQQAGVVPHGVRRRMNGATRLTYQPSDIDDVVTYLELRKLSKDALIRRIFKLEIKETR